MTINLPLVGPERAGKYRCLVVDPPWDQCKTGKRAVRPNQTEILDYPTLKHEEISKLPIDEWAADESFLWLWATNSRSKSSGKPILEHAFELMEGWGFRYYTLLTWTKKTGPCPFGPYQITTEHCLFGYRGRCSFPRESLGKMRTAFEGETSRHSEKPTSLYQNVKNHFPGPYLDVFARRRHESFDVWGNEVEIV